MLYGRRAECDALDRLLADARRSRSGVLVVRGEAGVGKSALLDHAAGQAEGMTVLRAAGVESEAELPFAALHQLLRPVLGLAGRLPGHQAAALAGALGLEPTGERDVQDDRFLVSVAVLSLLAEAADARPVLGLVDEAQWLDRSSAEALGFAARRLEAEGVVLLFAARDGDPREFPADGLPELRLGGLDLEAAAALLAAVPVTDKTGEFLSDLLQGMGLVAEGDGAAGEPRLRRAIALAGTMNHPRRLMWAGVAAFLVGDNAAGDALFARAAAKARQDGAVGLLPQALEYLAPVELVAGRLDAAAATAGEGLRLARDTGNDTSACRHLCTLAHLAAIRGDEDACRAAATEALDRAAARGLGLPATLAGHALALLDLGMGRPAEALARLQRLLATGPGAGSPFFAAYTVPDLVEAAVRAGQEAAAAGPLAAFEQLATAVGTPDLLAQLARCRGLVGPDEEAAGRFEEALDLQQSQGRPFDLARTELAYGEALRRARRRGEARAHLRSALESFQRLEAAPWAERAGAELRATGETARKRDPSTLSQLTPQELQIVQLVGEGGTNREIGAQLFLSRRTIDYHLRNVFVKLGMGSRAELIRLALADR